MNKLSAYASIIFAGTLAITPALAQEQSSTITATNTAQQSELFPGLNQSCNFYAAQEGADPAFLKDIVGSYFELSASQGNVITSRDVDIICRVNSRTAARYSQKINVGDMALNECSIITFSGDSSIGLEICNQGGTPVLNRSWNDDTPEADGRSNVAIKVDRALETVHDYEVLTGTKPAGSDETRAYIPVFQHLLDGNFEASMSDGECRTDNIMMSDGLDYAVQFCDDNDVLTPVSVTTPTGTLLKLSP